MGLFDDKLPPFGIFRRDIDTPMRATNTEVIVPEGSVYGGPSGLIEEHGPGHRHGIVPTGRVPKADSHVNGEYLPGY